MRGAGPQDGDEPKRTDDAAAPADAPRDDGPADAGSPAGHDDHGPNSLTALLERLERAGRGPRVAVAEIVDTIGARAFSPLLLVPALILISPASGVPGLSSIGGMLIALVAVQIVIGRRTLWLPGMLRRRTVGRDQLDRANRFLRRPAAFVDRWTRRRLAFLTEKPFSIVPALLCLAGGLVIPFFELVPMSSSIIATAVAFFALALVTRDGLLVLIGLAVVSGAATLGWLLAT
ncbi:exopolysaccharide biosynthesis protein [Aquibium sp. A9E412]|uniref:exopolysaccharide biosynthesis protein n=1 Tax=Aquibium sp. A9E412 TaxID=2976767 RepID=UPI0025B17F56|nr:exopolysaccharide biosynthesis protein [Aquibium sp. A9E412]MDN2566648.1 exopolysaccharide biosynthesis protein [Aquibium sp. A9E412]